MLINNFDLVKQKRSNTCGYATAAMVINYLTGKEITEDFLVENDPIGENGITFYKLEEVYNKYLTNYNPEIVCENKEKTFEIIRDSLREEVPLHILYLTPNELEDGKEVLHYAALIGYDEDADIFILADPYGNNKSISRENYFEKVSFNQKSLPEEVRKNIPGNLLIRFN